MKGQLSLFDIFKPPSKVKAGEWVEEHGKRVLFDDIREGEYYVDDKSTYSKKWYKIVYTKKKTNDTICYVDSEKGINKPFSWGNSCSAMTRQCYTDAPERPEMGAASTSGWWYEVR